MSPASCRAAQLGANIALRDTTLPTYQAQLDEFSETLASQFAAQGLNLFTDASGNVPTGGGTPAQAGYVGFSADIQVNPAVQTDPALVPTAPTAIAGSPTGATAFTPNPTDGPAGFTTLITRVLDNTFGADVQPGVAATVANVTGLGPVRHTERALSPHRRLPAASPPPWSRRRQRTAPTPPPSSTPSRRCRPRCHQAEQRNRRQHGHRDVADDHACRTPTAPMPG